MKKNIKKLIESLFDDYDDIIGDNDISQNSQMIENEVFTTDIFESLLDIIEKDCVNNRDLRGYLFLKDKLVDLSKLANVMGGFGYFDKITIDMNNSEAFKQLFDILNIYNIPLNIKTLEIQLGNNISSISILDFIDLSIYNKVLNIINELHINSGKLKNFNGFPNNIYNVIEFNNITYIETMQGFPVTKYNLSLIFNNSAMPQDWSECPNKLHTICFKFDYSKNIEEIKKYIGILYNIPYDLTFESNDLSNYMKGFNIYIKFNNINNSTKEIKNIISKYINDCLKTQYKNVADLKKRLLIKIN